MKSFEGFNYPSTITSSGADDELNASPYWRVHSDVRQTWSVLSSYRGRDLYSLPFSRNISWAIVCFSSLPSALFIYQLGGSKSPLLNQLIKQPTPVHWWKKNALVIFLSHERTGQTRMSSVYYTICSVIILLLSVCSSLQPWTWQALLQMCVLFFTCAQCIS